MSDPIIPLRVSNRTLEITKADVAMLAGEFHQMSHALDAGPDTNAACEFNIDEVAIIELALRYLLKRFDSLPDTTNDTQTPT